jgi:pimeloyl-ACP methyl ester carboxylesterase
MTVVDDNVHPSLPACSITGRGIPVVLVHSTLSHKEQWHALSNILSRRYQVIAVDLIGHGGSARRHHEVTLMEEAHAIESLLSQVLGRLPAFHVVGHSYGAGAALRMARDFSDRVASLALFEPTSFHVLPPYDTALDDITNVIAVMKTAMRAGAPEAALEVFTDYWGGIGAYAALPTKLKALLAARVDIALGNFRALLNEPASLDDYAKLDIPACLISGTTSPESSRRVTALLADAMPRSELFCIEGGHLAPVTQPDAVNAIIERFLATCEAERDYLGQAA